jgi:EAL domain-containing protein (putative c-di-GMP-specific phosphodiesterase class I)
VPSDLIALAERTGLIVSIAKWALVEACRRVRYWRELQPERPLVVAINVSARQLHDSDFGSLLWRVLAEGTMPPSLLTLEATEDAPGEDISVHRCASSSGTRSLDTDVASSLR